MLSFIALALFSCADNIDFLPEQSFIKIVNDESFENTYHPMDIVQAGDDGYFILSAYNAWNIYLLRLDATGDFLWDTVLPDNYVNPIKGLYYRDNAFYFFCMDDLSLSTYLMKASDTDKGAQVEKTFSDIIYPLSSGSISDGYLLESYNRESYSTRLTKISNNFDEAWHEEYGVEQDIEEAIIAHLTRIGDRLPFFVGEAGSKYFLNGFYNYSMSLLFVNATDGKQTGVINGFRSSSAISSAHYLNGNEYALSRFDFGDNYIMPVASINTSGTGISTELGGNAHPEMVSNASVFSRVIDVNGRQISLFSTTTKGGQVLLYAYDAVSGTLTGTHHLGHINPFESIDFEKTNDGGLVILGSTAVNGRFSKINLIKLSKQQLIDFAY